MKKVILLFAIAFAAVPCFAQLPFAKCEACKKAGAKFFQGDPQGAIALLDEAIAKDPSSSDAYRMRGDFRGHLGDFKRSVEDYKAALALDPSAVDVYEKLARWQMFLRDYYGALATLDAALAHGVKSESVYVQRGDLHLDRQDIGAATVDYTNAIAASPNSVRGYVGLAHVFESKGEINSAIAELQTFLRNFEASGKTPKDKSVKVPVGELKTYERPGKEPDGSQDVVGRLGTVVIAGNTLEEIEKSKNAMERSANIRSAYYFLASLFQKIGDLDQAILSLDKGIALKSDEGQGHGLRANARIAKGDLNGAIEDLEAALKDPMPWQDKNKNRGLLYTLQGRDEDAAKEFAQFLQRFPKAKDELDKEIAQAHALYTRNATK